MASQIAPTPTLTGEDAKRFLKEKDRIEKLDPQSIEAKERNRFLNECVKVYNKTRPIE